MPDALVVAGRTAHRDDLQPAGSSDIYLMDADGSHQHRLGPSASFADAEPDWSPAVLLPGSLARISLMITWAGAPPTVMVNVPSLWSVAVDVMSLTRTLAALVLVVGSVQAKLPVEARSVVMTVQFAPPSRVYSIRTLATLNDVQVMFCTLPPGSDSPPLGETTVTRGVVPPPPLPKV